MVKVAWCKMINSSRSIVVLISGLVIVFGWLPDMMRYRIEQRKRAEQAFSNFFIVTRVGVGNTVVGESVYMDVDRSIMQPFKGDYSVTVREFPGRALVCRAGDDNIDYDPSNKLPDSLTLHWWADNGGCDYEDLYVGEFVIDTTWTKRNEMFGIPNETITVTSNPFTVSPVSPRQAEDAIERQKQLQRQIETLQSEVDTLKGN